MQGEGTQRHGLVYSVHGADTRKAREQDCRDRDTNPAQFKSGMRGGKIRVGNTQESWLRSRVDLLLTTRIHVAREKSISTSLPW